MQPDPRALPPRQPDALDTIGRYARQPIMLATIFAGGYLVYSLISTGPGGLGWIWVLMGLGWGVMLYFAIGVTKRDLARQDRQAAEETDAEEAGGDLPAVEAEPTEDPADHPQGDGGPDPVR